MLDKNKIPVEAMQILKQLQSGGYKSYFVGVINILCQMCHTYFFKSCSIKAVFFVFYSNTIFTKFDNSGSKDYVYLDIGRYL